MKPDREAAGRIDRFLDQLNRDVGSAPPAGLDAGTEQILRALVAAQRDAEEAQHDREAAARVWERTVASGGGEVRRRSPQTLSPPRPTWSPRLAVAVVIACALIGAAAVVARRDESGTSAPVSREPTIDADALLERTLAAFRSPEGSGIGAIRSSERVTLSTADGRVTRTETARSLGGAGRWRIEQSTTTQAGSVPLGERDLLAVSDGGAVLTYQRGERAAVVSAAAYWQARARLGTLAPAPGVGRTDPATELAVVLEQAGACFSPAMAGSETVAGRAVHVVEMGPSRCARTNETALLGRWRLWIDSENALLLRAVQEVDGVARLVAEVTALDLNAGEEPSAFVVEAPPGVPVIYPATPAP